MKRLPRARKIPSAPVTANYYVLDQLGATVKGQRLKVLA
jgi:hypothetical protein